MHIRVLVPNVVAHMVYLSIADFNCEWKKWQVCGVGRTVVKVRLDYGWATAAVRVNKSPSTAS